ncbi:MAG: hypothetical protein WCY58_09330 [Mariniphaga sp.]|nr:hypothetical protein [Mariniphaga sp.]MDD4224858.1 hypothetical protein [Mariniphaga sp.]MDD4425760.1 hypothetical protein [Mariniphaga sp.]
MNDILKLLISFFVMLFLTLLISCEKIPMDEPVPFTDYSNPEHWLSLPTDLSKDVDVFYVYPTAWYKEVASEPNFFGQ